MHLTRLVAAALVLGACSGGGGGHAASSATTTPSSVPKTTTTTSSPTAVDVNKTINFEEFTIDILQADTRGGTSLLKLTARVTNTLTSPQEFNPNFVVTSAGKTYDGQSAKNPTVSPNGTVAAELDVGIDSTFTMSDAIAVFGNNTKNQSMVPLGASGTFTPLLDVAIPNPGPVTAGLQTFTFTNSTLSAYRYDGSQLDAGTWELRTTVGVKNSDPANTFTVSSSDFRFVNGGETLNSGTIRDSSANAGGSVNNVRIYADVDNYVPGAITLTVVGADDKQNNVTQTATIPLPTLQ